MGINTHLVAATSMTQRFIQPAARSPCPNKTRFQWRKVRGLKNEKIACSRLFPSSSIHSQERSLSRRHENTLPIKVSLARSYHRVQMCVNCLKCGDSLWACETCSKLVQNLFFYSRLNRFLTSYLFVSIQTRNFNSIRGQF